MKMLSKEASRLLDRVQITSSRPVWGRFALLAALSSVVHFTMKTSAPRVKT